MGNTVLIVDDAEFMRVMLREIVCEMGLTVAGRSGATASRRCACTAS